MTPRTASWARALALLLCGAIRLPDTMDLYETEFGGGALTGPLTLLCLAGCVLFLLDAPLTVFARRPAALLAACATLLCLPLDLYRLSPRSLAWLSPMLSGATASVPHPPLHPDVWSLAQLLAIAVMAALHAASRGRRPA